MAEPGVQHGERGAPAAPWARLLALVVALCAACGESGAPGPNLMVLVVDTLRADHSSAYGYSRPTTPRLEAVADQGVRFENAYVPVGLTGPTHASLFTGLHPFSHGVVRNGLSLGPEHVTLAEYLAVRGYQTAAVVSSFVLDRKFGLRQGFDSYDDAFPPGEATTRLGEWEGHAVAEGFDRRADHTTRRAAAWLRERRDPERAFFLFVHYFDPHSPYAPPPSHARLFAEGGAEGIDREIAAYDAEIAFTDAAIGELLDVVDELGLAEDTLLVVTADHGEGLMQRGYMLHGVSVHEEELRVPLLLRWPGRLEGGRVVTEPVSLLDLFPTVAELVAKARHGGFYEGRSLARVLRGVEAADPERPVFVYRRDFGPRALAPTLTIVGGDGEPAPELSVAGPQYGVRAGRFKYVVAPEEAAPALYDLEADPGEERNRAGEDTATAARLAELLDAWLAAHPLPPPAASEPSAEDRARLRALGYTD